MLKRKCLLVFIISMMLLGCTANNPNKNDNTNKVSKNTSLREKEKYKEYIQYYFEDIFFENDTRQYGVDEFAVQDVNQDGILDLLVKNNDLNMFSIITLTKDGEITKVLFDIVYYYQYVDDKIQSIKSECDDVVSYITRGGVTNPFMNQFPLYEDSGIYLINNNILSIPIVIDETWGEEYYFFMFDEDKPKVNSEMLKYEKNLQDDLDDYYNKVSNLTKIIPYSYIINSEPCVNGRLDMRENSITSGVNIYNSDGNRYSSKTLDRGFTKISSSDYDKMYYNYDTNTKGENIKTIEKIKFYEYNKDNLIKILG